MTGTIGQVALLLLLLSILASIVVHCLFIYTSRTVFSRLGRYGMVLQFVFAAIAAGSLVKLLVSENLHYPYVAEYTGAGLPLVYRIAAFWGGNAGSLLLWALVLTLYGAVTAYSKHEDSERMLPIVSLILSVVTLFFALIVNFSANPFERVSHLLPANGLNPLLQNPGMTVHPVNVYLGYIGFTIPFSYAMAGLILKKTDATWLKVTRRWTLISWLFLSIGIVYGAHWSYEELGWGGYWAWDPVENASLLPWLTGTAFLHSAIVQEKKGMLKGWNVILITLTFLLTLLGTFLTRSGVLWSIHAFSNSVLGNDYLVFLCVATLFSAILISTRWSTLRADRKFEAVVSKETTFLLNNVLFLASAFAVLWGTIFPLVSEALSGQRMMVSAPFYNAVNLPLAICIMLLMGIGPVVAWRRASVRSTLTTIVYPFLVSIVLGLAASGVLYYIYQRTSVLGTLALIAALFVTFSVFAEFFKSVQVRVSVTNEHWSLAFLRLLGKNRRRYGGYIVHLAIAVMAAGIAGSGSYHVDVQQQLADGKSTDVGGYHITFEGMGVAGGDGNRRLYANLVVERGGRSLGVLRPAAVFYTNGQAPSTDVAIYSQPLRDLYVVMLGTSNGNQAVFDIHVNPLVEFIWFGGYFFIVGTIISLWPESKRARQSAKTNRTEEQLEGLYQSLAELEYDYRMGKLENDTYRANQQELLLEVEALEVAVLEHRKRIETEIQSEVDRLLNQEMQSRGDHA